MLSKFAQVLGGHLPPYRQWGNLSHVWPCPWLEAGVAGSCPAPPAGRQSWDECHSRVLAPGRETCLSWSIGTVIQCLCPSSATPSDGSERLREAEQEAAVPAATHSSHTARSKGQTSTIGQWCKQSKQPSPAQRCHHAHPPASTGTAGRCAGARVSMDMGVRSWTNAQLHWCPQDVAALMSQ